MGHALRLPASLGAAKHGLDRSLQGSPWNKQPLEQTAAALLGAAAAACGVAMAGCWLLLYGTALLGPW